MCNIIHTLVVLLCILSIVATQCTPPTGPACLIEDSSHSFSTFISSEFWVGVAAQAGLPSTTPTIITVSSGGGEVAVDGLTNCGFVFVAVGASSGAGGYQVTFTSGDIAAFTSFYNAGGIITLVCENGGFAPFCPASLNPLISQVDPTVTVRFTDPPFTVDQAPYCPGSNPVTSTGLTSQLFTTPNDFTTRIYTGDSDKLNIPAAHPDCLAASRDTGNTCVIGAAGNFVFSGDYNPFAVGRGLSCVDSAYVTQLGENFGNLVATCGGSGGDPHIFTFDGTEIEDLPFVDGRNYLLYSRDALRVVIQTSQIHHTKASFITQIGVSIGSHQLLATLEDSTPVFYIDGELVVENLQTSFGTIELYIPDGHQQGALAELQGYQTLGLKVGSFLNIVGGILPRVTGFFNVEIRKSFEQENGILARLHPSERSVTTDLSQFEVSHLF